MPHHAVGRLEAVATVGRPGEATVAVEVSESGREVLVRVENTGGARAGAYLTPGQAEELSRALAQAVRRATAYQGGLPPLSKTTFQGSRI